MKNNIFITENYSKFLSLRKLDVKTSMRFANKLGKFCAIGKNLIVWKKEETE